MKTQTQKILTLAVISAGLMLGMAPQASFAGQDRVLKLHTDPLPGKTIDLGQVLKFKLKLSKPQPSGARVRVSHEFFCNGAPTRGTGLIQLDHNGMYQGHTLLISRMAPSCRQVGKIFKARFRVFKAQGVNGQVVERSWKISDKRPAPKQSKRPTQTPPAGSPTTGGIVGPGFQLWQLDPPARTKNLALGRTITAKWVMGNPSSVRFVWACQATGSKMETVAPIQQAQKMFGYPSYAAVSRFTPRDGTSDAERRCTGSGSFIHLQAFDTRTGKLIGDFIWNLVYRVN